MENRQRTIRKLLWRITAVLAVLAVVSICFVSGTFARYVTKNGPRLQGHLAGIGRPAQLGPLGHDLLRALAQMVVVLGELGGDGENGVAHRLAVLPGGGQAPALQKGVVHHHPHPVGVHQGAVKVKELHR